MSKCKKHPDSEAIHLNMCESCVEGLIEDLTCDNSVLKAKVTRLSDRGIEDMRATIAELAADLDAKEEDCAMCPAQNLGRLNATMTTKIAELQAKLAKDEWISVEDRLPEGDGSCRVYVLNDGMAIVGGYIPENNEWFYVQETGHFHSSGRIEKVTHWKPFTLPEPKDGE